MVVPLIPLVLSQCASPNAPHCNGNGIGPAILVIVIVGGTILLWGIWWLWLHLSGSPDSPHGWLWRQLNRVLTRLWPK